MINNKDAQKSLNKKHLFKKSEAAYLTQSKMRMYFRKWLRIKGLEVQ